MSSVNNENEIFLDALKAKILGIVPELLFAAAHEQFMASVEMTVQDSGQAAASWNISLDSASIGSLADKGVGAVGETGEKRSRNGGTEIVIAEQKKKFDILFPVPESLIGVTTVYVSNPATGNHAVNANLVAASQLAIVKTNSALEVLVDNY